MYKFFILLCFSSFAFSQEEWGQWNDDLPKSPDTFSTIKEFEAYLSRPNRSADSSREKAIKNWLETTTGRDPEHKSNESLLDELAESLEKEQDDIEELEDIQDSLRDLEEDIEDAIDDAEDDLKDDLDLEVDDDQLEDALDELEDDLEDELEDELDEESDAPDLDDKALSFLMGNEKGRLV